MTLALWGGGGFVGRAICKAAEYSGLDVLLLPHLHVADFDEADGSSPEKVRKWLDDHRAEQEEVIEMLRGVVVVVNAAGLAEPAESNLALLMTTNAVLPGIMAGLAARARVPRLIHVSSAAVQGRRDPLDESMAVEPFSPYSYSKAAGERLLAEGDVEVPQELIIYRPTSIQGPDRPITKSLVRLASRPIIPLPCGGDAKLPVCLLDNVASGILHVARLGAPSPSIVLQPWEGMTTRLLMEAFGGKSRIVPVPKGPVRVIHRTGTRLLGRSSRLQAKLRRTELLAFGQSINATVLESSGFRPVGGFSAYRRLAEQVRGSDHPLEETVD